MPEPRNPRPHFVLPETLTTTAPYRAVNAFGRSALIPHRNRVTHAAALRANLETLEEIFPLATELQRAAGWEHGFGLRVAFSSFQDVRLAIDSLDLKSEGIELLNVRETEAGTVATVWIPEGRLELFENKITAYLAAPGAAVRIKDNRKLLDAIREIRAAVIEDLWTDQSAIPADDRVATFEAWLSTPVIVRARRRGRNALRLAPDERIERFRESAERVELRVSRRVLSSRREQSCRSEALSPSSRNRQICWGSLPSCVSRPSRRNSSWNSIRRSSASGLMSF